MPADRSHNLFIAPARAMDTSFPRLLGKDPANTCPTLAVGHVVGGLE